MFEGDAEVFLGLSLMFAVFAAAFVDMTFRRTKELMTAETPLAIQDVAPVVWGACAAFMMIFFGVLSYFGHRDWTHIREKESFRFLVGMDTEPFPERDD